VFSIHTVNENAVYHLQFINDNSKVNAPYYLEKLLSQLVEEFKYIKA